MDILQRIINMDKAAAARAEKAVEKERRLLDESGEEAAKARSDMVSKERERVDAFISDQRKMLSEKLSKAEKTREEQCRRLDEVFDAHRSEWKSEILKRITEG